MVAIAAGIFYSLQNKDMVQYLSTAAGGSFVVTLGLDHFAGRQMTSILYTNTVLARMFGVVTTLNTCGPACYVMTAVLIGHTLMGLFVQLVLNTVDLFEAPQLPVMIETDEDALQKTLEYESYLREEKKEKHQGAPKANFNIFDPFDMPANLRDTHDSLHETFQYLTQRFGFQLSNCENQLEHLIFLLGNTASRKGYQSSLPVVHFKLLSNYRQWCDYLGIKPDISGIDLADDGSAPNPGSYNSETLENELALWLLIWGEAANLRHMPESICFLYHSMIGELHSANAATTNGTGSGSGISSARGRIPIQRHYGSFLTHVVSPIYSLLKSEKGDIFTEKRNYDDFNEFFWNKKCLHYYYADSAYGNVLEQRDPNDGQSTQAWRQKKRLFRRSPVSVGLAESSKTYLERRSWLHPIRSFFRLFSLLMSFFHMLVCLAFLNYLEVPLNSLVSAHVMSSVIITVAALSLVKELLNIWASYGIIRNSVWRTCGFILRLTVKTVVVIYLGLFFVWTFERDASYWYAYLSFGAIYLAGFASVWLAQLFPSISTFVRQTEIPVFSFIFRLWWPINRLYVGRDAHERGAQIWKYQLYWVTLLAWKMFCSYYFQVSPLIKPTIDMLFTKTTDGDEVTEEDVFIVAALWAPFVLVYFFDPVIWFALWQGIAGVWVGMQQKIGQVRDFPGLVEAFKGCPAEFDQKLVGKKNELRVDVEPVHPSASSAVAVSKRAGEKQQKAEATRWRNFAIVWDEILDDLRESDLINNDEKFNLRFRFVDHAEKDFYFPLFQLAGCLETAITQCETRATEYKAADPVDQPYIEYQLANDLNDKLIRESISEVWELSFYVLFTLLGPRHEYVVNSTFRKIYGFLEEDSLLRSVNLTKIRSIKPKLLNLVRGLRIATASYKSMNKSSRDSGGRTDSSHSGGMKRSGLSLNRLIKAPSSATLNMLETINTRSSYKNTMVVGKDDMMYQSLHVNLIRDQMTALLGVISGVINTGASSSNKHASADVDIPTMLKGIMVDENGFAWDDAYACEQINLFVEDPKTAYVLKSLRAMLTTAKVDVSPGSAEAQRRLVSFVNSLFMDLPVAPSVQKMYSWSVLTPFYSEDIIYSYSDLQKTTEDGISTFLYLQTIYPKEWENFLERIGVSSESNRDAVLKSKTMEARLWATRRGQTLARTVDGMMLYEKALRTLAKIEEPNMATLELHDVVKQKFQYVVSAQVYGRQKREGSPKAKQIEKLLQKYPNLRIAYIDSVKVPTTDKNGRQVVKDEFYSVLIKSVPLSNGEQEVRECFRIKLPGNPVMGEGKPENQNHAIIFTRGEMVQAIDMNQSGYLEESFKMRNLLQEFKSNDDAPRGKHTGIVGFREHIYTGSLSSIANYMAMQEGCFVTLGQRVLADPLRMRLHYGHPDMFDKMFFMSRGGVSKAAKGVNLSEDIFAGFNTVLRGASVEMKEYIQVGKGRDVGLQQLFQFEAKLAQGAAMQTLSRDVYRMCQSIDIFRLFSFFYGGLGFYISNSLTIWALYLFLYARVFLATFRLEDPHSFSGTDTIAYWFGQIGFLLTVPIFCSIGLDKGFRNAAKEVGWMLLTGGPLFFMFHMGTKAHYFNHTILAGNAIYRPTGRGFVTKHVSFGELYRFHATSHFYKAFELMALLVLYYFCKPEGSPYGLITWAGWLIVAGWLFAPFWFNPMAFEWSKNIDSLHTFNYWMARQDNSPDRSWTAWWSQEVSYYNKLDNSKKFLLTLQSFRHALVGMCLLSYKRSSSLEVVVCAALIVGVGSLILLVRNRVAVNSQFFYRATKAILILVFVVVFVTMLNIFRASFAGLLHSLLTFVALFYVGNFIAECFLIWGSSSSPALRRVFKLQDYFIGWGILATLCVMSILRVPSIIQTRLMFHNAFSRGVLIDRLLNASNNESKEESKPAPKMHSSKSKQHLNLHSRPETPSDSESERGDRDQAFGEYGYQAADYYDPNVNGNRSGNLSRSNSANALSNLSGGDVSSFIASSARHGSLRNLRQMLGEEKPGAFKPVVSGSFSNGGSRTFADNNESIPNYSKLE